MTINAHDFVADKLINIVEDKHKRMQLMVNSFTIFGLIFLILLFINSLVNTDDTLLSSILGVFSLAALVNVFVMNRNREAGRIGLTIINYSLALLLLYSGGYESTGMLWSYLLVAVGIFINSFRTGLILNIAFLVIASAILLVGYDYGFSRVEYAEVLAFRVILTLFALSGMCHILIFFQSRADEQILSMHEGGIASLAYLDSLTMLSNRVTFRSVLYHEVQLGHNKKTALVYIDLDNFKPINDLNGHDFGDLVLAEYAKALKKVVHDTLGEENVGEYDVGRLGGDEFAVFVRDASDEEKVRKLSERILTMTNHNQMPVLKNIEHNLGSSIGVVFVNTEHQNLTDSLSIADKGMYEAKKAGKGAVRYINMTQSLA
ncbi:GGDEF domain-containing protein [Vibrio hannami]|uniref:GGDEF domain-containing protein n=1 Tax=Vibrio hannami TaxID=2717094 RepID=UPI00240F341B|nr:GGDEF domain-containing protein [Vibrio hannami]MDG3084886.1 GGDEF domain-containing protein [Vibrio hannami]